MLIGGYMESLHILTTIKELSNSVRSAWYFVLRCLHGGYRSNFEMEQSRGYLFPYIDRAMCAFDHRSRHLHFRVLATGPTRRSK